MPAPAAAVSVLDVLEPVLGPIRDAIQSVANAIRDAVVGTLSFVVEVQELLIFFGEIWLYECSLGPEHCTIAIAIYPT